MVPLALYGTGTVCSPSCMYVSPIYGIGIVWSPTCTYGPPLPYMEQVSYGPPHVHVVHLTCEVFSCLIWLLWSPHTLYWNRYHMVPPHVKCLHILYDSYGPPNLVWNRYLMVPHMYIWSPNMYVWSPQHVYDISNSYSPPYLIRNVGTL